MKILKLQGVIKLISLIKQADNKLKNFLEDKIAEVEANRVKVIKVTDENEAIQLSQQKPDNIYYWS